MNGTKFTVNAVWNLAEALSSSVAVFVLYKLILARLGVASLGVWSLVLATTAMGRFADLGAASGLGRYVAVSMARGASDRDTLLYVETAFLFNFALYCLLGVALFWPARWGVGLAIHNKAAVEQARGLMPYALTSFGLMNIANVMTAALVGLHKSYQKSMITVVTLVLQLGIAVFGVPRLGLRAVALAQIAQYVLMISVGWVLIVKAITGRWRLLAPHRLGARPLRELLGFGLRLQALNVVTFPFEPVTKFVFSAVGGLSALGMFELAWRGFTQVRQFVIAPSQNLTPMFAAANEGAGEQIGTIYDSAVTHIAVAAFASMAVMGLGSPIISLIWFGRVDHLFVTYSVILACGWFLNIVAVPGYMMGIGTGRLRWNIVGSAFSTVFTGVFGYCLSKLLGPSANALGAMIALVAGNLLTWSMNCRAFHLRMVPGFPAWRRLGDSFARLHRAIVPRGA